jgi:HK97 family phage portal protein
VKFSARALRQKSFELFNGLFDFGAGEIQNGFYPVQIGGQAGPPINIVRTMTGDMMTPKRSRELAAVWACTWLIADTIATLPFSLNKRKGRLWGDPIESPTAQVICLQPNQYMDAHDFWQFMFASKLLWGNAYATIDRSAATGELIELEPLLPQFMIPYKKSGTGEMRYKYVPQGLMNIPMQDFAWDEIFHLKDRTLDGMIGMSRIEYARQSLGIARAGEMGVSDTFRNGMKTQGFLQIDRLLKPDQRRQLKEELKAYATGGTDAGGFMVLEAGMTFEGLTLNPQDVQLLQTRQFEVEDICRWFGVPPVLIGHNNMTSWGTGIEQLVLGFQTLTLRPHIRKLVMTVNRSLVPPAKRGSQQLKIDLDDLMAADSAARSMLYGQMGQNGIMTRNEMRAREGLEPMEGGDTLTVQSNLIPLDKLEEMGGQPTHPSPFMPGAHPGALPGQPGAIPGAPPPAQNPNPPPAPPPAAGNGKWRH